jgi:proline iminopeptidase
MAAFTTGDGVDIYYETHGTGPRVYVCNGGPAADCRYLVEDLADFDGFELVFHDYRGGGRSANAPPETYTLARLARDLDELSRSFADEPIAIVGHSLGGVVAQTFALAYPERLDRLVLASTFATANWKAMLGPTLRAMSMTRFAKMTYRSLSSLALWSWRSASDEKARHANAGWTTTQEGLPAVRAREIQREVRLGYPLSNDNIAVLSQQFSAIDFTPQLPTITAPVLVIVGARDAACVASWPHFRFGIAHAQHLELPDIGHDVFFEAPTETFAALRAFLGMRR